jgi:uncharacterized protein
MRVSHRRPKRPLRWSLAHLLLATAGFGLLLAAGIAAYEDMGAEFFGLAAVIAVFVAYYLLPWGAMRLAEATFESPRGRTLAVDGLMAVLAGGAIWLAIHIIVNTWNYPTVWFVRFSVVAVSFIGTAWLPLVFVYWSWRDDQLSPQLDVLQRYRQMKPTVAILGASADRSKYGNKSIRAHVNKGYDVYPVNPKGGEIEGLRVFASLAEIPVPLKRISVYLPPAVGAKVMEEIAAKGCEELFLNPGSDAPEVVERARELGLDPIVACSIVEIGERPGEL